MTLFSEFFFVIKKFPNGIPFKCNNNTEIEGKLISMQSTLNEVSNYNVFSN